MIEVSPSLLPLSNDTMVECAEKVIELGVPRLHLDIIDGKFVNKHGLPNNIVKTLLEKLHHRVNIDVHLMVTNPMTFIQEPHYRFASKIYIHIQPDKKIQNKLHQNIVDIGCEPGIVINPNESIDKQIDFAKFMSVLIMGVVPGLSGQKMLPNTFTLSLIHI